MSRHGRPLHTALRLAALIAPLGLGCAFAGEETEPTADAESMQCGAADQVCCVSATKCVTPLVCGDDGLCADPVSPSMDAGPDAGVRSDGSLVGDAPPTSDEPGAPDVPEPLDLPLRIDVIRPTDATPGDVATELDIPTPDAGPSGDVCAPPRAMCGVLCVDLQNSANNCGACGRSCAVAEQCVSGSCAPCGALGQTACRVGGCLSGLSACDGSCRNVQSDIAHCGACGRACTTGSRCESGMCRSGGDLFLTAVSSFARASDGAFRAWGTNTAGQLADGTTTARLTPSATMVPASVVEIAGGTAHACARMSDGTVLCWGSNSAGQLGDGAATTATRLTPAPVPGLDGVVSIAAAGSHTCAVRMDGTIRCWGSNTNSELGVGDTRIRTTPTAVVGLMGAFVSVSAGLFHNCARRADGVVYCWGVNTAGQLGSGPSTRTAAGPVTGLVAADVVAGYLNTCARRDDGSLLCWGNNAYGQVGDGTNLARATPVPVRLPSPVAEVRVGAAFVCARLTTMAVQCWGYNSNGALGDGTTTQRLVPTPVMGLSGVVGIANGGSSHTCARLAVGGVRCWGYNRTGQLGDGSTATRLTPVAVPGL